MRDRIERIRAALDAFEQALPLAAELQRFLQESRTRWATPVNQGAGGPHARLGALAFSSARPRAARAVLTMAGAVSPAVSYWTAGES